jgi:soluble lytic murein transglycosylase-like protein
MKSPYREVIREEAAKVGLDPLLVEAVIQQESSGRADAFRYEPGYYTRYLAGDPAWADWEPRRASSSYGLMQLMYPTAVQLGFRQAPEALFDIRENIRLGCKLLASLLERFSGDVQKALAAYNGGPAGVTRPRPRAYATEVQARYARLQASTAAASRLDRASE